MQNQGKNKQKSSKINAKLAQNQSKINKNQAFNTQKSVFCLKIHKKFCKKSAKIKQKSEKI